MAFQKRLDLFGNQTKPSTKRKTRLENGLINYDKKTFEDRLRRLKYIRKIFPKCPYIAGEPELVYTFLEAKDCFIVGHFIATIILAQSFIEKIVQNFFLQKCLTEEAKKGLANMLIYARNQNLINEDILNKINVLRLKRNPFTHLKDIDYPHRFSKRMIENHLQPHEQLEEDASEAMQIMFLVSIYKF